MNGMEDVEDMHSNPNESEPAESPESKQKPITEDGAPESTGETIKIPKDFLEGTSFREGDELVLKVVAVGDDGIEVAYAPKSEKGEMSANDELDSLPEY